MAEKFRIDEDGRSVKVKEKKDQEPKPANPPKKDGGKKKVSFISKKPLTFHGNCLIL